MMRRARTWRALVLSVGLMATLVTASEWTPASAHSKPAAQAPSGCGKNTAKSTLAGSTANAEALGVQVAFNLIPGPLPLSGNLVEDDLSFARTSVAGGPQVTAQAAPYYPGDIAANLTSLLSANGIKFPVANDPLQAFAGYPASPKEPADSRFPSGLSPAPKSPIRPGIATAHAHAGRTRSTAVSTLADMKVGLPAVGLGLGRVTSTNRIVPSVSCMTSTAGAKIAGIDLAGLIHISSVASRASARTDGTTAQPQGWVHVGEVKVLGLKASLDSHGIHILNQKTPPLALTPKVIQGIVNHTLAQDGINVRLVKPSTTSKGGAATAESGALEISFQHAIDVPYVPGEPVLNLPGLGNVPLPSGLYKSVTTITLGASSVQANGTAPPPIPTPTPTRTKPNRLAAPQHGGSGPTSNSGLPDTRPAAGTHTGGAAPVAPAVAAPGGVASALEKFIPGLPAPVGWIVIGLLLCLLFSYPMLYGAWAQLVRGREGQ